MIETKNYKKVDTDTIRCLVCNHYCRIKEGKVGVCGVRKNISGKPYLLVYGQVAAAGVDLIEKKPFYHFLPGSGAYSLGTFGCNFKCDNCQNYEISQPADRDQSFGKNLKPEEIIKNAKDLNCQSVACTYNEPTVFLEYALDTMKLAHKKGLKNIWVSNGFMSPKTLGQILPYLDAINIDLKSFSGDFYKKICGAKIEPVLGNLKQVAKSNVWLEVTTLIIPTLSDDENVLRQLAEFIKKELSPTVPWHISTFSETHSWKLKHLKTTSLEKLKKTYQIGKSAGLKYVYGGNVLDEEMSQTECYQCGALLINRSRSSIKISGQGKCSNCGAQIDGVFN